MRPGIFDEEQAMGGKEYSVELLFKALADRTRLRLLNLMGNDEVCVCFFVEILKTNQPKISRHLAYLRRAGLVSARREGKWMRYKIVEPFDQQASRIFREIRTWLANDPSMQRDRNRLMQLCCAPQLPVQLQKAPRPASLVA
jgi:ArsR family transcriptional regulator, arsenate/arsenite/antimonite-responsive transcriptional repressor